MQCPASWADLWIVFVSYCLGSNPAAGKTWSHFSILGIFQNSFNCMQIAATPRRSIFHTVKSLQVPHTQQIIETYHRNNHFGNSIVLRLVHFAVSHEGEPRLQWLVASLARLLALMNLPAQEPGRWAWKAHMGNTNLTVSDELGIVRSFAKNHQFTPMSYIPITDTS